MIFRKKHAGYKYALALLDWLTVCAAFLIAYALRGRLVFSPLPWTNPGFLNEIVFIAAYAATSILIFRYFNLYKVNVFATVVDHTLQLLKSVFAIVFGLALLSFFARVSWIVDSRLATLYFTIIVVVLLLNVRVLAFRKIFSWVSGRNLIRRNLLIVGAGSTGRNLAIELEINNRTGHDVIGFLDDELPLGRPVFNGFKVIGRTSELAECVDVFDIDEIVVCLEGADHSHFIDVLESAVKTRRSVKISSPLYGIVPSRLFVEQYGRIPIVSASQTSPGPAREILKRLGETVLAAIGLTVLLPVFVVVAILIKFDTPGPVFFKQTRLGKNGRPFTFYKFRSMLVGSDHDEKRVQRVAQFIRSKGPAKRSGKASTKIVNESRVTRVGQWIRKTSFDELPQLFNVLKGDMSLVGPRPCLPYEWEHYQDWHKRRLNVLPGCTGMWQVSGRSVVGFDDMVVLDLYYIQNASFWLDLRLFLRTIPVMLFGVGAK